MRNKKDLSSSLKDDFSSKGIEEKKKISFSSFEE